MLISEKRNPKRNKLRYMEYYDLTETFDKLYNDSKQGKKFTSLMDIILSENNIELAFRNLKGNKGSNTVGVDNKTMEDVSKIPKERYIKIIRDKMRNYESKVVRRVEIPKPNGKMRPLGIPTIWDRIIQQCILQVLEPICEAKFHERSNAFRPNRSVEHAMAQCYKMIHQYKLHYVVDIDIEGFFDNVDHSKLKKQLWNLGVQDKQLICIISQMLKAPIQMLNGSIIVPTKGTPQVSNIVLNELDWWVTSQWEEMLTRYNYQLGPKKSGKNDRSPFNRALKTTKLKEMYIVRYADDFKIFCANYYDAKKTFIAVETWLKERLRLSISKDKSKIVNLKNNYSEFLGFKLKAIKKGNSYVVCSHMVDKAIKNAHDKLVEQIEKIQNPRNSHDESFEIRMYNTMVVGIHNYYMFATCVSLDCNKLHRSLRLVIRNRLGKRVSKKGVVLNEFLNKKYGVSGCMRYVRGMSLVPISYIQHKNPMYKSKGICQYTPEGRAKIHKNLGVNMSILMKLMREKHFNRSIEYMDNRISLYCAQHGKCAITKQILAFEDIHCHHKLPKYMGGMDNYQNLIILHKDVHTLIHATNDDTIAQHIKKLNFDSNMIEKINRLRDKVGNSHIYLKHKE